MRNAKLGNHLKTLNVFFESAFEDLSFYSFLKASDCDFEEKNGCNKHRIWFIEHNFDCSQGPNTVWRTLQIAFPSI